MRQYLYLVIRDGEVLTARGMTREQLVNEICSGLDAILPLETESAEGFSYKVTYGERAITIRPL